MHHWKKSYVWSFIKIVGVLGGISLLLCVGILFAARQAPPQNQWVVYYLLLSRHHGDYYRMQPDGSAQQRLDEKTQSETPMGIEADRNGLVFCIGDKKYWATTMVNSVHSFFGLGCTDYYSLSPDGKWIYFAPPYKRTIYRMRLDGSQLKPVFSSSWRSGLTIAGWSPDEAWVYIRLSLNTEYTWGALFRMRPDGSESQLIIDRDLFAYFESWSLDHQWAIFDSGEGLYKMHPDGTGLTRLTKSPRDTVLMWKNDGKNLILETDHRLWEMNWATGKRRLLSPYILTDYQDPQLSPDKKWILYQIYNTVDLPIGGKYPLDWCMFSLEDWRNLRLTYNPEMEINPLWSPDGQWLYFAEMSNDDSTADMYRIRPDGTGRQLLSKDAIPLEWLEPRVDRWQPTHLALIGLVMWGVGTFAPFLRRHPSLS